jgi:2-octaprenylphenol hydroxylase
MKTVCDVVIVGAGIVGMTLAARLASGGQQQRLRITLIDGQKAPRFSAAADIAPRVSAISTGSMKLLAGLGVADAILEARACPYRDMRVWDAGGTADGPEALRFDAAELALPQLGYIVENVLLQHCLLARLRALDVELRFRTSIAAIERTNDGFDLVLDGDERRHTALLIGADGANSGVRKSAGIAVDSWRYPQASLVTHAEPAQPHRHTAWQRFLPGGPLALLPLADGRVSVVWSTSPQHAAELLDADEEAFSLALSAASDFVLGALRVAGPRASFPLRAQHARKYVDAGVALIGDAAHTVHPLAGQGANLGLADADTLATVIEAAIGNDEFPADLPVLRRYERARKGANKTMLYFIDGLNRLFAADSPLLARLRGGGMRLFNHSGPLRHQAMQVALGLKRADYRISREL